MDNNDVNLRLRFDADQVTKSLDFEFKGFHGPIFKSEGRCANTFHFPTGGLMYVEVTGTARIKDSMTFVVNDFTMASISTSDPGQSALSLFDPKLACVSISNWSDPVYEEDAMGVNAHTTVRATNPLPLVAKDGQWQMSGYLSVEVVMYDKPGNLVTMQRLFYFDPESTAGSGGNINI